MQSQFAYLQRAGVNNGIISIQLKRQRVFGKWLEATFEPCSLSNRLVVVHLGLVFLGLLLPLLLLRPLLVSGLHLQLAPLPMGLPVSFLAFPTAIPVK